MDFWQKLRKRRSLYGINAQRYWLKKIKKGVLDIDTQIARAKCG